MRTTNLTIIISICVALTAGADLFGEVIHVPDDFEEIQAAISDDGTEDGDTVLVAPGTYGRIDFSGKNIVVASYILTTGDEAYIDSTVIDGEGERGTCVFIGNDEEDAELVGFSVTGGTGITETRGGIYDPVMNLGGGIFCEDVTARFSDLVIFGNEVDRGSDNFGSGIFCYLGSYEFKNVEVFDNQGDINDYSVGAVALNECSVLMESFNIHNNIMLENSGLFCLEIDIVMRNVAIHSNSNNERESNAFWNCTIEMDHVTIANNVAPRYMACGGSDMNITNSILWSEEDETIIRDIDTIHISYCTIRGGREGINGNNVEWGEGNIDDDPLFIDPDNGDFHLTEDSPCIDAGDPDSPLDPDSTRADMGAYYLHQRDIDVDPDTLEFLGVQTGICDTLAVMIRNIGLTPLTIYSLSLDDEGSPFEIISEADTFSLEAESETTALITFFSNEQAEYRTTLRIASDDPDEDIVLIPIIGTALGVDEEVNIPLSFAITGVYPNPFNSSTTITYGLNKSVPARLALYDLSGRRVRTLVDEKQNAGVYRTILSAENLPSGLYFLRLEAMEDVFTRKIMLVR